MVSEPVLIAFIVALAPTLAVIVAAVISYLTHKDIKNDMRELHIKINSRMDELIKAARLAGINEERERKDG